MSNDNWCYVVCCGVMCMRKTKTQHIYIMPFCVGTCLHCVSLVCATNVHNAYSIHTNTQISKYEHQYTPTQTALLKRAKRVKTVRVKRAMSIAHQIERDFFLARPHVCVWVWVCMSIMLSITVSMWSHVIGIRTHTFKHLCRILGRYVSDMHNKSNGASMLWHRLTEIVIQL